MGLSTAMEGGLAAVGEAGAKLGAASFLAQQQAEIEALRDARLQQMKLDLDQTTRDRNVADAATERTRIEREAQGMANADSAGLISSARSQYQNADMSDADKAAGLAAVDAAESDGAYKRAPTNYERSIANGDYTGAENIKNLESDNSRLDRTFDAETEHRAKTLGETIRHNKQLEAQAAEKISPAARAQLEMANSSLTSAHKAEAEAFNALIAIQKDRAALPADVESAKRAYEASKKWTQDVHARNNELGKALFGDEWKTPEPVATPKPDPDTSKIPKAASDALLNGKGTDAQFDKLFGEGAAAKVRATAPKAAPAPAGVIITPGSGSSPRANIHGTPEAKQRRIDELERIVGDNGNSRDARQAAEKELATLRSN